MNSDRAEDLIKHLGLQAHPEGGYFREIYRSADSFPISSNNSFPEGRSFSTSIYFLLRNADFSAFHRIRSDEVWHFYEGNSIEILSIDESGKLHSQYLGANIIEGESYQYTVKAGHWFASRLKNSLGYALVACTVSPGFDFRDFEMAGREQLLKAYPQHSDLITSLTRI